MFHLVIGIESLSRTDPTVTEWSEENGRQPIQLVGRTRPRPWLLLVVVRADSKSSTTTTTRSTF